MTRRPQEPQTPRKHDDGGTATPAASRAISIVMSGAGGAHREGLVRAGDDGLRLEALEVQAAGGPVRHGRLDRVRELGRAAAIDGKPRARLGEQRFQIQTSGVFAGVDGDPVAELRELGSKREVRNALHCEMH
jgi:hypothetical protein